MKWQAGDNIVDLRGQNRDRRNRNKLLEIDRVKDQRATISSVDSGGDDDLVGQLFGEHWLPGGLRKCEGGQPTLIQRKREIAESDNGSGLIWPVLPIEVGSNLDSEKVRST